jgi:hypothetical protein
MWVKVDLRWLEQQQLLQLPSEAPQAHWAAPHTKCCTQ